MENVVRLLLYPLALLSSFLFSCTVQTEASSARTVLMVSFFLCIPLASIEVSDVCWWVNRFDKLEVKGKKR